jgi:hypothetical protein
MSSDGELIGIIIIGLILFGIIVKFWRVLLGLSVIGAAIGAVLCFSGKIDCPFGKAGSSGNP